LFSESEQNPAPQREKAPEFSRSRLSVLLWYSSLFDLAGVNARANNLKFEPQSLEGLQDFSDLASWLALLKINNEAQTRPTGHRQVLLGDFQLSAPGANSSAKLLWIFSIHVTDWEYIVP
jgi:hypothetical protein